MLQYEQNSLAPHNLGKSAAKPMGFFPLVAMESGSVPKGLILKDARVLGASFEFESRTQVKLDVPKVRLRLCS